MRLWVDFNDIEDRDYVEADLDHAQLFDEEDLHEGVMVDLFDGGGHECRGEIVAVDLAERLVRVKLDWATWRSTAIPAAITMGLDVSSIDIQRGTIRKGFVRMEPPSVTVG